MRTWLLLGATLALGGCPTSRQLPRAPAPGQAARPAERIDPWVLECRDPTATTPALLWNGLVGVRIGRSGAGLDEKHVPLPFFMIDEYERGGEEKIRSLPNPLVVVWELDQRRLRPQESKDYRQALDMRTGVLSTAWNEEAGRISCETVLSPLRRVVAQRWRIRPARRLSLSAESLIVAPQYASYSRPRGDHRDSVHAYAESGAMARILHRVREARGSWQSTDKGFVFEAEMGEGEELVYDRVVALGPGDLRGGGAPPADPPESLAFEKLRIEAEATWRQRWRTDIVIDGPVLDQQAVRSFLFHLRSAAHTTGTMSISPFALSHSKYHGHVFWDADVWVFPVLALVDPPLARQIPAYRTRLLAPARKNFLDWLAADRPTLSRKLGPYTEPPGTQGLMFPWESSVSGRETTLAPTRHEHHITGSVAFAMHMAALLGLADPSHAADVAKGAAAFYRARSTGREILDIVGPNEGHRADNDLYTNLVATFASRVAAGPAERGPIAPGWGTDDERALLRHGYKLPRDARGLITYERDPLKGYQQTAALLSVFPLQYPPAERQARLMMERFADKTTPFGPAMSDSIHATIWARLGEGGKSYDAWRSSWEPFRRPLGVFSELRADDDGYFTTGAAGSLQCVIYGFLGFRIDWRKDPTASWSKRLAGDHWLTIRPHLPRSWKSVTFRNFTLLGRRYNLLATHDGLTVTQGE